MDNSTDYYSDLWVFLPDLSAAPLLGEARRLADALGCYVHALLTAETLSAEVIPLGADRVHVTSDPGAFLITQQPEFVFFPATYLAPAALVAQHFHAGLVTDARNLSIDDATRALLASHPVYDGDYFMDVAVTSAVKVATLDPRQYPAPYADDSRSGEVVDPQPMTAPPAAIRDLGPVRFTPPVWRPLTKVKVVVGVGQGIKDADGLALAQQLADKLGAELAGDRSGVDFGWVAEDRLVGVTGTEIAPQLYIALGIRGDTYHNAAIVGARQVIAVHANPEAAIFAAADWGVVADPKEFLPQLLARL